MLKNKQPNQNESSWNFRPLVYISAFFNPVSRKELSESIERARETVKKSDQTSAEYTQLSQQVQAELGRNCSSK